MLQRCDAQAQQFYELFEALGVSRAEVAALAGTGLGRAEAGMAAAEAARGEDLDTARAGASPGAGSGMPIAEAVAAAASAAASAMATERPRSGLHSRRPRPAGAGTHITESTSGSSRSNPRSRRSHHSARPATGSMAPRTNSPGPSPGTPRRARVSQPSPQSPVSPRQGWRAEAEPGTVAGTASPGLSRPGRPQTAAAGARGSPLRQRRGHRGRHSTAGATDDDDRLPSSRSRSRSGSKRRTEAFLARMADLQCQKEASIRTGRERQLVEAAAAAAVSGAGAGETAASGPRSVPTAGTAGDVGSRLFRAAADRLERQEQARAAAGRFVYDKRPAARPAPRAAHDEHESGPGLVALLSAD